MSQLLEIAGDETLVRDAAVAIAAEATNGDAGRWKGDPVFEHVTEGRQTWWLVNGKRRDYSSCGDLPHETFFNLFGARAYQAPTLKEFYSRWMNRKEAYGWKVGWNIVKLQLTGKAWRKFTKGDFDPKRGDALLIGEYGAEHVAIVESVDRTSSTYVTHDYGQFNAMLGKHGGKRCTRKFGQGKDGRIWVGATTLARPAIGVVDVFVLYKLMLARGELDRAVVPDSFAR